LMEYVCTANRAIVFALLFFASIPPRTEFSQPSLSHFTLFFFPPQTRCATLYPIFFTPCMAETILVQIFPNSLANESKLPGVRSLLKANLQGKPGGCAPLLKGPLSPLIHLSSVVHPESRRFFLLNPLFIFPTFLA